MQMFWASYAVATQMKSSVFSVVIITGQVCGGQTEVCVGIY